MTIQEYLKEKTALLARAGIDDAEAEAFLCFETASGMNRAAIRFSAEKALADCFPEDVVERIDDVFSRRASHEPLAYIVRKAPFFDLEFAVGPGVLIPRFDTEILVETALGCLGFPQMLPGDPKLPIVMEIHTGKQCNTVTELEKSGFFVQGIVPMLVPDTTPVRPVRILDLCTGSGCVGITIAHELQKKGVDFDLLMTDISPEAAAYAKENAKQILGDSDSKSGSRWRVEITDLWPKDLSSKFDLIVSNPPYVTKDEMEELAPEVRDHEPDLALTDGGDGLLMYRRIAEGLKEYLDPYGVIAVEHGCDQGEAVRQILNVALGNESALTIRDYGDKDRVTCGKR